jgi:hypothetical protein
MKPVCPDDQIEIAYGARFKGNANSMFGLFDPSDTIVKNRFYLTFNLSEEGCGEVFPRNAYIAALSHPGNCLGGESRYAPPGAVYDPYLPDHVTLAADLLQQPHTVSDVEP